MDYNKTQTAIELGIYYENFNLLMGLTGVLFGFVFMFFMTYIFIAGAKK